MKNRLGSEENAIKIKQNIKVRGCVQKKIHQIPQHKFAANKR